MLMSTQLGMTSSGRSRPSFLILVSVLSKVRTVKYLAKLFPESMFL